MVAWRAPSPARYSAHRPIILASNSQPLGEHTMKTWRKPKTTEIAVGTEINAYACAAL